MTESSSHRYRLLQASGNTACEQLLSHEWIATSIGPVESWPSHVWAPVWQMIGSPIPAAVLLSVDRVLVANDAWRALFATPRRAVATSADLTPSLEAQLGLFEARAARGEVSAITPAMALLDARSAQSGRLHWMAIHDDGGKYIGLAIQCLQGGVNPQEDPALREHARDAGIAPTPSWERRYRQILDSAVHFAVMATDLDGLVTFWNSGAEAVLGWTAEEIIGASAEVIFVPEDRTAQVPASEMQTALRNGRASDVRWHQHKSGERFWANGEMTPLLDDAGQPQGFVKILTDQTRQHQAQQALLASEDQLRRAQEAGGVGVFTLEVATDRLVVTPAFCRIFGLDERPVVYAHELERLALPDDVASMSNSARRQDGSAPRDVEYRIRRADNGEERTIARRADYEFDLSGKPVRMAGVVQDVTARRAVEQALRESEAQFRILAQAVPNQVWTADAAGHLDWLNERIYEFGGIERTGPATHQWPDLVHEDDAVVTEQRWREALANGTVFEAELRVRRQDGEYRWHLARAIPIRGDAGEIHRWIGTNTDIHDQKLALAEHALERDRLWTMSQDLMLVCDFEGVISAVNPSASRLLGWQADEMIGALLSDFIHPDDLPATAREVAKLALGRTTLAFENRYRAKNGAYRLLDWTAVPGGERIHAVGRDITNERAVARNQERIWTLSPVLKLITSQEGRVQSVNPAWTRTLGWSQDESLGRTIRDFIADADAETARVCLVKLASGQPVYEQELLLRTQAGEARPIMWTFVPEYGTVYGFGRDLSEQRQTEEALRQSQKMEAVGQLTGGIAHDFNNLLQGITGSLDLMQRRLKQGRLDDLEKFVGNAMTSARRASALTHRLLAFSRRQPLDPRAVEVNSLIRSIEDLLRRTLGEGVDVRLELEPEPWLTRCDPNQLESAVLNMVINARDAMPDGGDLSIVTTNRFVSDAAYARTHNVPPGEYVCLSVIDSGVGMDADTAARAFEPFFTTKPMGQGTGLGLSMIYGFAQQSGGFASIDSTVGQGTSITVALPRYQGALQPEPDALALIDVQPSQGGVSVLVVEDEVVVRGLIVEVLRELNYQVHEAADGPSGLAMLQSSLPVDLLVTDIGLPGLNGRQIADAGRAVRPELKVLLMTGYAETAAGAAGFLEPGMTMITKPFAMEHFATRVREILNDEA